MCAMPATTSDAVKTYRYVRLAMVALVVGLGVALVVERLKVDPGCFQHSISAYYYTPVRGMFVGGLLGIGVCLVALRDNSDLEDALLNLAGGLAPVVAFVPTPNAGSCSSTPATVHDPRPDVFNNITTLLVLLAVALVLSAVLLVRERGAEPMEWALLFVGVVVWAAALVIFWKARGTFLEKAHYTAAIAMFACIVAVVVLNALGFHDKQQQQGEQPRHPLTNRYAVIAGLMLAAVGGIGVWDLTAGWDHAVLFIEGALIILFAAFWLIQTEELWEGGTRRTG
jgi:hypothetical protein